MSKITINLPSGMTRKKLEALIDYLIEHPNEDPPINRTKKIHRCEECSHWKDTYCAIHSCNCATAILNHNDPPRFVPRL